MYVHTHLNKYIINI